MNLKQELKKVHEQFLKSAPQDALDTLKKASEKLAQEKLEDKALKVGDKMPIFSLKNAVGTIVNSKDLLEKGPLVINFYRGGWWPYCNLELGGYQEILPEIHELGAQLVAISPELPDESLSLVEKHSLEFQILSDINNEIAKKFGIVFSLDEEMQALYSKFGIDLIKTQGNENHELPVPATYVVDSDGTIILSHVNIDYTTRLEPEDVLEVLK